ncbi:MAG TPA: ABC transporter substrate-binding protein, partial [Acidimicrobiales bacterium]|nr:ABC transporter substrate-binding protein [Acidimicrobiales bacterium]
MRRRLAAGLTAAALVGSALATTLASSAPLRRTAPSTLELAIPGPFGGCDPGAASTTAATDAVLSLVLPSAFTPGPLDVPVGDTQVIAEAEVVSTSPQTVVYTIAPGITWPSGRPFVAADLVRTWHERRHDGVLADLGYRDVADVVPDPTGATVTVTFRAPYSDWASLFDLIVPGPTARARCTVPTATLDPSIGPYAIVAATRSRVTLEANPLWPDPPGFPRVVVTADPAAPVAPGS